MEKKILVVDDEELIVRSLRKLLEKHGYTVFIAKNGLDALEMVDAEGFDLLIADIRMPGLNGVETVQSIYNHLKESQIKPIPVIFITGYADEEIKRRAKALEPLAYVHKPFDIAELVDRIEKAIGAADGQ